MGHLINCTSIRIGWTYGWEDNWFINSNYYPEFIHWILNIRRVLFFWLTRSIMEQSGFFYSHLSILKFQKHLLIDIWFHHGKQLFLKYSAMGNFFKIIENLLKEKKELKKSVQGIYFFLILGGLFPQLFKKEKKKIWKIKKKKWIREWALKKKKNIWKIKKKNIELLNLEKKKEQIFFYKFNIFLFFLKICKENWFKKLVRTPIINKKFNNNNYQNNTNDFVKKKKLILLIFLLRLVFSVVGKFFFSAIFTRVAGELFFKLYCNKFIKKNFDLIKKSLTIYLGYVFPFYKTKIEFKRMSNWLVTAKFLSRYLTTKLNQGFSIRELANPISRHLSSGKRVLKKNYDKSQLFSDKSKLQFKRVLKFVLSLFNKNLQVLKIKNGFYLSFDIIIILKQISIKNKKRFQGFCKSFLLTRGLFSLFLGGAFKKEKKWDIKFFYNLISCWNGFRFFHNKGFLLFNPKVIKASSNFLFDVLKFKFWAYNYKSLFKKKNKMKYKILKGFKFHFLGRFSRKQRAASIWYKGGTLPLNTINSYIIYSSNRVALINSEINVKVWLHYENWDLLENLDEAIP